MGYLILATLVGALAFYVSRARAREGRATRALQRPTATAVQRIWSQIRELESKLAGLPTVREPGVRKALSDFKRDWIEERLAQTTLEALGDTIQRRAFNALTESGIRTVAELGRVHGGVIPGIGEASADKLRLVYDAARNTAQKEFEALPADQIDALSGGALDDAHRKASDASLAQQREAQAIEFRIAELRQRLEDLGTATVPPPDTALASQPARMVDTVVDREAPRLPLVGTIDVVGESHYQRALEKIAGRKTDESKHVLVTATLVPQLKNPHDPNAVEVHIQGHLVGHLSRSDAAACQPVLLRLDREGRRVTCAATILGGWDRGRRGQGSFGVKLHLTGSPLASTAHPPTVARVYGVRLRRLVGIGAVVAFPLSYLIAREQESGDPGHPKSEARLNPRAASKPIERIASMDCQLRAGPQGTSLVVGYIVKGERLLQVGTTSGSWTQLSLNKQPAQVVWISSRCLVP